MLPRISYGAFGLTSEPHHRGIEFGIAPHSNDNWVRQLAAGGLEENRTPVRKPLDMTFSVGSRLLLFPTRRRQPTNRGRSGSTFLLDRFKCERSVQVHRSDDAQSAVAVLCRGTGNPQVTALPIGAPEGASIRQP